MREGIIPTTHRSITENTSPLHQLVQPAGYSTHPFLLSNLAKILASALIPYHWLLLRTDVQSICWENTDSTADTSHVFCKDRWRIHYMSCPPEHYFKHANLSALLYWWLNRIWIKGLAFYSQIVKYVICHVCVRVCMCVIFLTRGS